MAAASLARRKTIEESVAGNVVSLRACGGRRPLSRRADLDRERPFRTPLVPIVPALSIAASVYRMTRLGGETWLWFRGWLVLGLVFYFLYSRSRSVGARREAAAGAA